MTTEQNAAIVRLIEVAKGTSGGARRAADFLLSWWNAEECGKFDLTDLWGVDPGVASDMVTVFSFIARNHNYPDELGLKTDFDHLVAVWRPQLASAK